MSRPFTPILVFLAMILTLPVPVSARGKNILIPYRDGAKWGYCNKTGKVIIPPTWDLATGFGNGKARVAFVQADGRKTYCLIDRSGNYLIPPERNWTGELRGTVGWNIANASDENGHYGCIDSNNHEIIPIAFDYYPSFELIQATTNSTRYYGVYKNNKEGLVKNGKLIIPTRYEYIQPIISDNDRIIGFILPDSDSVKLMVDTTGRSLLSLPSHRSFGFTGSKTTLYWKDSSQMMFWLNFPKGTVITRPYESFVPIDDKGHFIYGVHGKYGIADYRGQILLPATYDEIQRVGGQKIVAESRTLKLANPKQRYAYVLLDSVTFQPITTPVAKAYSQIEYLRRKMHKTVEPPVELTDRSGIPKRTFYFPPLQVKPAYYDTIIYGNGYTIFKQNDTCYLVYKDATPSSGSISLSQYMYPQDQYAMARVDCATGTISGYALADAKLQPKTRFQPNKIVGWNGRGQIILRDSTGSFSLVDSSLESLVGFQPGFTNPNWYFIKNGRRYAEVVYRNQRLNHRYPTMIVDANGKPASQFIHYGSVSFQKDKHQQLMTDAPLIATNKDGKKGWIDFSGNVLFPAVSFNWRYMKKISDNLFKVGDGTHYQLVDRKNRSLLPPEANVFKVEPLFPSSVAQDEALDQKNRQPVAHVFHVYLENAGQCDFYLNDNGRVYVKDWTFLKQ